MQFLHLLERQVKNMLIIYYSQEQSAPNAANEIRRTLGGQATDYEEGYG